MNLPRLPRSHRDGFLLLPARFLLPLCAAPLAAETERKANVIVIISDDHGYADVGFQGCQDIPTPHLDALAKGGVRCTDGYVTCPVWPTRAGLMIGRYQQRTGFEDNAWNTKVGLSTAETTLADRLKAAGYATLAIGKWHLGQQPQFRPLVRGFTDHYGFLGGGRSFLPIKDSVGVAFVPKDPMQTGLWRNEQNVDDPPYLTDAFGDAAVDYIKQHKQQPFFIYLAFNAVHVPLQATDKYLKRFPETMPKNRRTYAAMLSSMDDAIGRVTEAVATEGLERDTLIFFLSDNGGHPMANSASNKPLRAEKGTIYEGGIRVPFLVKWTGKLPAGSTYSQPVISLDIMPTALAAAGATPPENPRLDGVNLIPYLSGQASGAPHETLYWRFVDRAAIRHGDWKLTMPGEDKPQELFNLASDKEESKDLSAEHPETVAKLKTLYKHWEADLPPAPPKRQPQKKNAAPAAPQT